METVKAKLVYGMEISGEVHKDFEVRVPLVEDMVEAEKEVSPTEIHAFNVALLCRITVRVGSFEGPFTPVMFKRLKRHDYSALVQAMMEADQLGEPA